MTKSFTDGCDLSLIFFVTDSTTDAETTVFQELQASLSANVAGNTRQSHNWRQLFIFSVMLLFLHIFIARILHIFIVVN